MHDEVWFIEYQSNHNGPRWLRFPTGFPTKEEAEYYAAPLTASYRWRVVRFDDHKNKKPRRPSGQTGRSG
jgi:hypothetical protein